MCSGELADTTEPTHGGDVASAVALACLEDHHRRTRESSRGIGQGLLEDRVGRLDPGVALDTQRTAPRGGEGEEARSPQQPTPLIHSP